MPWRCRNKPKLDYDEGRSAAIVVDRQTSVIDQDESTSIKQSLPACSNLAASCPFVNAHFVVQRTLGSSYMRTVVFSIAVHLLRLRKVIPFCPNTAVMWRRFLRQ
jgi:hypothetical protein